MAPLQSSTSETRCLSLGAVSRWVPTDPLILYHFYPTPSQVHAEADLTLSQTDKERGRAETGMRTIAWPTVFAHPFFLEIP